jgi:glycerol-3-phosphate acyltransferase PlsY
LPEAATWAALPAITGSSVAAYLLGSIPSARWVAGRSGIDPLAAGEGNPGAANVWRLLGPRAGAAVLGLDIGKGAAAALLGLVLGGWWAACAGVVLALVGHAWPPWSRFRGGRGVACLIGGDLILAPLPFTIALLIFGLLLRPARLWRAAAAGLLAYPIVFLLLVPDRWRLIGLGFAYLILLIAWWANKRRPGGG